MGECPEYRVRLFMSVDLVGSTAFKAKNGDTREPGEPYPIWLNRTKSFYREFPNQLNAHFHAYASLSDHGKHFSDRSPKVWKTVGDEIIFCVRVVCLEHLACCIRAFMKTLTSYGNLVNKQQSDLDVKGCAWIASFPAPNVTIVSAGGSALLGVVAKVGENLQEVDEVIADLNPGDFDFLGKQIDTGFRISKFAQSHELAVSIDLAWLLTLLKQRDLVECQFIFRGREALKGVIGGTPYPIVTLQTERSHQRRELDALERMVEGISFTEPVILRNYLHLFMEQNQVEIPIVTLFQDEIDQTKLPKCYFDLKLAWQASGVEDTKRKKLKKEADEFEDNPVTFVGPVPEAQNVDEINVAVDKMIRDYWSNGTD